MDGSAQMPGLGARRRLAVLGAAAGLLAAAFFAQCARAQVVTPPAGVKPTLLGKVAPELSAAHMAYLSLRAVTAPLQRSLSLAQRFPAMRLVADSVIVDAVAASEPEALRRDLLDLGASDVATFGAVASARLPLAAVAALGELSSLRFVRPAYAATHTGATTSQGDVAQRSDIARTNFGVDGSGIMVGVLSDSYDCLGGAAGDVASGDLPPTVAVLEEESLCSSGTDEGRAMLQHVYDVAPGSALAFHSAFNGQASFANGILRLAVNASADVIVDDVIYFAEPMFQDGAIAQAAATVTGSGVPYFSSAGNSSTRSYESGFVDSGLNGPGGGPLHDFDPGPGTDANQQITVPVGTSVIISLQWDQPFFSVTGNPGAGSTNDVDIFVLDAAGGVRASGVVNNIASGDPVEVFEFTNSGFIDVDGIPGPDTRFQIAIEVFAGSFPARMKYVYFGPISVDEYATQSSTVYGHANAAGAMAVGAAFYVDTPAFGTSPPLLESFSSRGGTPILFAIDGTPLLELRDKPEFVAPDGGNTTFFGSDIGADADSFPNFFGTSAAAPHAAGVAALMLDAVPVAPTPAEVLSALQSTAVDMGAPGFDADTGAGLIRADLALALVFDTDGDGVPDTTDNCPTIGNPVQTDTDDDGLGDACDPDDDDDGLPDTVETNTGVFVDPGDTGTDPLRADSDGDGLDDGYEVANGLDPLDDGSIDPDQGAAGDPDADGFDNLTEFQIGSDPQDLRSRPALSSVTLVPGVQLLFDPLDRPGGFSAFDLLIELDTQGSGIDRIETFDGAAQRLAAALVNGQAQGSDFALPPGRGIIANALTPGVATFTGAVRCAPVALVAGINLLGLQCLPSGYDAFALLADLGPASAVAAVQRFDPASASFESAYYAGGAAAGTNFPLRIGESYLVHMREARPDFDPLNATP